MSAYVTRRARDTIVRLAGQGLDLPTFWRESSGALARVVPHYMTPCWFTFDPNSLLVTSHFQPDVPELPPEWLAHEYYEDDVHKMADVARSERGYSTLHEATGGDPSRSPGYNLYMRPFGAEQELLVALRTRAGDAWGMLGLYREQGEPLFTADEQRFLRDVSQYLAEGARRGLIVGEATDPDGPEAPGLVILREDWSVESLTPGVERWLAELPDSDWQNRGTLPPVVLAVAGRAALHDTLLVHVRPELASGHQPLPARCSGAAAGVACPRVLRGRCPQDGRRRPFRAGRLDAA